MGCFIPILKFATSCSHVYVLPPFNIAYIMLTCIKPLNLYMILSYKGMVPWIWYRISLNVCLMVHAYVVIWHLICPGTVENIESESKISYSSMLSWWNTLLSTQLFYGMLCFIVGNIMWIGMKHLDFGIYLMLMLSTNQTNSGIDWKMLSLLSLCEIA